MPYRQRNPCQRHNLRQLASSRPMGCPEGAAIGTGCTRRATPTPGRRNQNPCRRCCGSWAYLLPQSPSRQMPCAPGSLTTSRPSNFELACAKMATVSSSTGSLDVRRGALPDAGDPKGLRALLVRRPDVRHVSDAESLLPGLSNSGAAHCGTTRQAGTRTIAMASC